jgi:hypothetical protein
MKQALISLALAAALFFATLWVVGCTQIIIEPDRLQINTFLTTSGLKGLYYDPNDFFEVRDYEGVPADIKLRYNPVTGTVEVITDSNDLKGKQNDEHRHM